MEATHRYLYLFLGCTCGVWFVMFPISNSSLSNICFTSNNIVAHVSVRGRVYVHTTVYQMKHKPEASPTMFP